VVLPLVQNSWASDLLLKQRNGEVQGPKPDGSRYKGTYDMFTGTQGTALIPPLSNNPKRLFQWLESSLQRYR